MRAQHLTIVNNEDVEKFLMTNDIASTANPTSPRTYTVLQYIPYLGKALVDAGTEAVLCDDVCKLAGLAVVDNMGNIPLALMSIVTLQHNDKYVPIFNLSWPSAASNWLYQITNQHTFFFMNLMLHGILAEVNRYRKSKGLPTTSFGHRAPAASRCIHLVQMPSFFDFRRSFFPQYMYYTTPWTADIPTREEDREFLDKLDGRPVVYFSMGTMSNRTMSVFRNTAKACSLFPQFQLVMSFGKTGDLPLEDLGLPLGTIACDFVPQRLLLSKATVMITAGGLNSILEALVEGVPLIVIPMWADQPGNAARVRRLGAGVVISRGSVRNLTKAIEAVCLNKNYRQAALECQKKIREGPSIDQTVELLEAALLSQEPLLCTSKTAQDILGASESSIVK